jgi:Mg-chelatase subunit ChlD
MNTKLWAVGLLSVTAGTVALFPAMQQAWATANAMPIQAGPLTVTPAVNGRPQIEVVFVLDTTGSMGGLISAAKEKIWSIASTMASAQNANAPEIKMGLVAYRDRGDAYVTQTIALSNDLDSMYAKLMDFQADGGGDGPESVNQALFDAVNKISWNPDKNTYKVIFLVGDAPAHMDYPNDVKYPETLAVAKQKGIIVNAIQCGEDQETKTSWQQMVSLGQGSYFQVGQTGNAVAIATPYDKKLAELSTKLDKTRIFYGNEEEKVKQAEKLAATDKLHKQASEEARARRATFNASKSGKANFLGEGELVDAVASGRVNLASIPQKSLPAPLQAMSPKDQEGYVTKMKSERKELEQSIQELAGQRNDYLKKQVLADGGKIDSLDSKIYGALRKQAEAKGLKYDADSAKY